MWRLGATGLLLLWLSSNFLPGKSARLFGVHPVVVGGGQRDKLVRSIFHTNVRGGASPPSKVVENVDDESEEEYDELEEEVAVEDVLEIEGDDDEDEEQEGSMTTEMSTLSASALKAADKLKVRKVASVKSALEHGMAATPTSKSAVKKKKSFLEFKLPYILRACFNPVMLIAMTKAYWKSLFSLNYGKKVRHARSFVNTGRGNLGLTPGAFPILGPVNGLEIRTRREGEKVKWWFEGQTKNEAWPSKDAFGFAGPQYLRLSAGGAFDSFESIIRQLTPHTFLPVIMNIHFPEFRMTTIRQTIPNRWRRFA
jgi:hypothetical protein